MYDLSRTFTHQVCTHSSYTCLYSHVVADSALGVYILSTGTTLKNYEMAHRIDQIMRRIDTEMHRRIPHIDKENVGPLASRILSTLAFIEPAPIRKLVEEMCRDNSQMTRIIKTLESKRLIERTTDEADRRISVLSLTPLGREFVDETHKIVSEIIDELFGPLTPQQRQNLIEILEAL